MRLFKVPLPRATSYWACALSFCAALLFMWQSTVRSEMDANRISVVRVGVYENKPIVFEHKPGRFAGLAIDVIEHVASQENWRVVYVPGAWSELLEKLAHNEIDLLVGIAYSEERARRFQFTRENLIGNWGVVYKRPDVPIVSPLDLGEKRVAMMRDSIHTGAFEQLLSQFGVKYEPIYTASYTEALELISKGEADAGVVNRVFGMTNAQNYDVRATGIIFNPIYVHYAVPKSASGELVATLDEHVHKLKADRSSIFYQSLDRWLNDGSQPSTPAWLGWAAMTLLGILALTLATASLLRHQVNRKTKELVETSNELKREIAQRELAQERLNQLAYFDSITGLPNRVSFVEYFQSVMQTADRQGNKIALLFIDIDRLKTVNDSLGHAAGDVLIKMVGEKLRGSLRANDSIYRFGGDEFVIIAGQVKTSTDVTIVADRLLESLKGPVDLGNKQVYTTASIGIALYPDDDHTIDGLLKDADAAMYNAKEQGRNRYCMYNHGLTDRVVERLTTETRLRQALDRAELSLHYQPIIDLGTNRPVAVEALLRWNDPGRGMIPPAQFIPAAEDTGMIVPIGAWVLEQACSQVNAWRQQGLATLRVAVNVSSRQFEQDGLVTAVEQALKKSGLPPALLELEITEGVLLVLSGRVASDLQALKALGVRLAIDDFGTGYSNLGYLQQLPIDILKIDRSFVSGNAGSDGNTQIASLIITMAQRLGLSVVAEGIETEQQLDFLRQQGCELGQGYFIAHPMPEHELQKWLSNRTIPVKEIKSGRKKTSRAPS